MVTARSVFEALKGRRFTYEDLRRELKKVRVDNLETFPAEVSVKDLFAEAVS